MIEKRRVNGTFLEYLELETFPFDTQVQYSTSRTRFLQTTEGKNTEEALGLLGTEQNIKVPT